ncbi:hypothetical protein B0X78_04725 [bacterium AM6]|nr:hypothetical protein B0X78_04725 [bacterium AM6]
MEDPEGAEGGCMNFVSLTGIGLLAFIVNGPVSAAEASGTAKPKPVDSVVQTPLSADWAARLWLQDRGVTPSARIVIGSGVNSDGYKGSGWSTAEHIDLGAAIDTGKAFGFDGTCAWCSPIASATPSMNDPPVPTSRTRPSMARARTCVSTSSPTSVGCLTSG